MGEPSSRASASATCAVADSGRAVTRRVAGSRPRLCISSVKDIDAGEVEVDPWREHEGALPARPRDALLADELVQRAADGDQAAAVPLRELPLRGYLVARPPVAAVQRPAQVEIDLVVQGDRTQLEPETGHPARAPPPTRP